LFDLHPKEDRKELFGRDKEIDYAISQLLSKNWLAIGGQREIGKTSFMKVIISEMKKNYGFKGIYVNLRGVRNLSSLLKVILSEINNSKPSFKVAVKLNFIIGVRASLNFHEFVFNPQPLGFNRVTGHCPVHTPPPL